LQFNFTDEQEELRRTVRRFLEDTSPPGEVRRLMETDAGFDPSVWEKLCGSLGLAGIAIPEEYGGQGFGFIELALTLEEMGRSLLCAPYFASTVCAANAILNAGTEAEKKRLLPGIASGETIATLAVAEASGAWTADAVSTTAARVGDSFRLDGVKRFVVDGHTADFIVVVAREPGSRGSDGLSFFMVSGEAHGLRRRLLTSLDPTRKLAELSFEGVEGALLGELGAGAEPLLRTLDQAAIGLANEMVGGAQKVLESAVEYAKVRMQFGRPIGSFQAIKHRCADLLLEVEHAKSAAYYAAAAESEGDDDISALACLAKAACSDAYRRAASACIQIHGGVGFTWENDTHLYFKRARSSEAFLGTPDHHREQLLRYWGI
jgi:alkylation response protein AidB-like acyl-CoA dehydrogenase